MFIQHEDFVDLKPKIDEKADDQPGQRELADAPVTFDQAYAGRTRVGHGEAERRILEQDNERDEPDQRQAVVGAELHGLLRHHGERAVPVPVAGVGEADEPDDERREAERQAIEAQQQQDDEGDAGEQHGWASGTVAAVAKELAAQRIEVAAAPDRAADQQHGADDQQDAGADRLHPERQIQHGGAFVGPVEVDAVDQQPPGD